VALRRRVAPALPVREGLFIRGLDNL